jgi:hypothetical protein
MCPKNQELAKCARIRRNNKQIKSLELGNGDIGSLYVRQMSSQGNFGCSQSDDRP